MKMTRHRLSHIGCCISSLRKASKEFTLLYLHYCNSPKPLGISYWWIMRELFLLSANDGTPSRLPAGWDRSRCPGISVIRHKQTLFARSYLLNPPLKVLYNNTFYKLEYCPEKKKKNFLKWEPYCTHRQEVSLPNLWPIWSKNFVCVCSCDYLNKWNEFTLWQNSKV